MKKLMIAAAAAAMIGSVKADPLDNVVYQATYNLKTTIGKAATDSNPIKLGKDPVTGQFWYEHPSVEGAGNYWTVDSLKPLKITLIDTTNFKLVKKSGNWVPTLTPAGLKNGAVLAVLAALEPTYYDKSANQYCLTFNYAVNHCYRIAGTIKVDGYFIDTECLEGKANNFPRIIDCFGGATGAKCTKAELYSELLIGAGAFYDPNTLVDKNGKPVKVRDSARYPSDRTIVELSIAGHGTYGKVFDYDSITFKRSTRPGMTQMSGYAVGCADMPTCETCCAPGTFVDIIIDCCNDKNTGASPAGSYIETAVFGTFTFKYNDAETKKLY